MIFSELSTFDFSGEYDCNREEVAHCDIRDIPKNARCSVQYIGSMPDIMWWETPSGSKITLLPSGEYYNNITHLYIDTPNEIGIFSLNIKIGINTFTSKKIKTINSTSNFCKLRVTNDVDYDTTVFKLGNNSRLYFFDYFGYDEYQRVNTKQSNTIYDDGRGNIELLEMNAYTTDTLSFGCYTGIDGYNITKLNYMLSLTYVICVTTNEIGTTNIHQLAMVKELEEKKEGIKYWLNGEFKRKKRVTEYPIILPITINPITITLPATPPINEIISIDQLTIESNQVVEKDDGSTLSFNYSDIISIDFNGIERVPNNFLNGLNINISLTNAIGINEIGDNFMAGSNNEISTTLFGQVKIGSNFCAETNNSTLTIINKELVNFNAKNTTIFAKDSLIINGGTLTSVYLAGDFRAFRNITIPIVQTHDWAVSYNPDFYYENVETTRPELELYGDIYNSFNNSPLLTKITFKTTNKILTSFNGTTGIEILGKSPTEIDENSFVRGGIINNTNLVNVAKLLYSGTKRTFSAPQILDLNGITIDGVTIYDFVNNLQVFTGQISDFSLISKTLGITTFDIVLTPKQTLKNGGLSNVNFENLDLTNIELTGAANTFVNISGIVNINLSQLIGLLNFNNTLIFPTGTISTIKIIDDTAGAQITAIPYNQNSLIAEGELEIKASQLIIDFMSVFYITNITYVAI